MDKTWAREILGQKIREIRENAGFSRDELAKRIGMSRSTLERMENGSAPVEISDYYNIYQVCDANCQHDFFEITNPYIVERMQSIKTIPDHAPGYEQAWNAAYKAHMEIAKTFSLEELQTTNYLSTGRYGGDRYAVFQTFLAYSLLNLEKRDMDCGIILDQYEDSDAKGQLPPEALRVNVKYVREARKRGKEAHREGKNTYR